MLKTECNNRGQEGRGHDEDDDEQGRGAQEAEDVQGARREAAQEARGGGTELPSWPAPISAPECRG